MSELVFKDPPPQSGGYTSRWKRIAADLEETPGRWALIGNFPTIEASNGRERLARWGCEATCRTTGGGRQDLYARWPETNGDGS